MLLRMSGDGAPNPPPAAPVPSWQHDRPGFVLLTSHWLSRLGLFLAISALSSFLFVVPSELRDHEENPYKGLLVYIILPSLFFVGLAMIAGGIAIGRRRILERLRAGAVDVERSHQRFLGFLGITVFANLVVGTQLTYRALHHLDTPQFCGATCHTELPEYVGHRDSNHSSVSCVECHVAPGQRGWVESKMNGTRQLYQILTRTYHLPAPPALASGKLVPSRQTCERCHWAEKIVAAKLRVLPGYASDEQNTASYTVLGMLVGGSRMKGIHHAHFAGGFEIRYAASDKTRATIPWVEWRNTKTGETRTYLAEGTKADQVAALPKHVMQCVDCHNRPTHAFLPPEQALDRALALGQVSASLPFVRREGLAILKVDYATTAEAEQKIPAALTTYYEKNHVKLAAERKTDIAAAGQALVALYKRNVFPELKVAWNTYPDNIGHEASPGCFRCHDGSHATADGKATISQDCEVCHTMLASGESNPEILKTLGLSGPLAALRRH
jgi:nitrate/TMAO reductase-like tetraheme cytochrome c subunit